MRRWACIRNAKIIPVGSKMHGANWQMQVKHPVGRGLMLEGNCAHSDAFTNRYVED
jgi:hypothetical protein